MSLLKNEFIIPVNINKLIELKLPIEEFVFLYLLEQSERFVLKTYLIQTKRSTLYIITNLFDKGFVKKVDKNSSLIGPDNLVVTESFSKLFKNGNSDEDVDSWLDSWYDLWPIGVKSGGYYLKSDKVGSARKMKRFFRNYPNYTMELIFKATENYLAEQSIKGYQYSKLAPYFIYKDGLSVLAGECEHLLEKGSTVNVDENGVILSNYGEEEL
jgi:hypothetical protein